MHEYNPDHAALIQAIACGIPSSYLFCCLDREGGFSLTEEACGELFAAENFDVLTAEQRGQWLEDAVEALDDGKRLPPFPV